MAFEFQDTKKKLHHAKLWHNKVMTGFRIFRRSGVIDSCLLTAGKRASTAL